MVHIKNIIHAFSSCCEYKVRDEMYSLPCSELQVVALLYYTLSYFPGGMYGLKYVLYTFKSAAMRCFLAIVGR